jgi:SDR family mycofactocin-dependent oxidoreductase
MAGRVAGKVAFITGAARGQGRSHALTLAREGADIAAVDIGDRQLPGNLTKPATKADLDETVREVEKLDRRALGLVADISQEGQVKAAVDATVAEFGRIDIVVANAAVFDKPMPLWEIPKENWDTLLAVDLTGTWLTLKHTAPHLVNEGSGSVILVSSGAGLRGPGFLSSYAVSKFGIRGLMHSAANELGFSGVRVNSVHPGTVDTPGLDAMVELMGGRRQDLVGQFANGQIFKRLLEPQDISNAVLFLASDESRNVTGLEFAVDAGYNVKV